MSPAISIQHLQHAYSDANTTNTVLKDVSVDISTRCVVALLGQSGSGKSTLLNLISGLEPIQSGEISLYGDALSPLNDRQRTLLRRRKIGFIYQSFNLIPTLTVAENISLPLALNHVSREQQTAAVDTHLATLGLSDKRDQFPDRLSGGEQQRVAIARAIIHTPDLILADEPTGNLDSDTGRRVLDALLSITSGTDRTLLLVTHSQEVARVADVTLTLSRGELKQGELHRGAPSTAW